MIRDMQGEVVPYGKTARKIEEVFLTDNLPSWLVVNGDTGYSNTVVLPHQDYGYFELKTGNQIGNKATLNLLPNGVDMTKVKEIIVEMDSLVFSGNENQMEFSVQLESADELYGFAFLTRGTIGNSFIRGKNGAADPLNIHVDNFNILTKDEWKRKKNLQVRLRDNRTIVLGGYGDTFMERAIVPDRMNIQRVLYPKLIIETKENIAHYLRLSKISITLIHN